MPKDLKTIKERIIEEILSIRPAGIKEFQVMFYQSNSGVIADQIIKIFKEEIEKMEGVKIKDVNSGGDVEVISKYYLLNKL